MKIRDQNQKGDEKGQVGEWVGQSAAGYAMFDGQRLPRRQKQGICRVILVVNSIPCVEGCFAVSASINKVLEVLAMHMDVR